jgi:diacylglycerol kinase family enzyme
VRPFSVQITGSELRQRHTEFLEVASVEGGDGIAAAGGDCGCKVRY